MRKIIGLVSFLTLFYFLRHFPMALDLGCGRGHISKFLTKVGTDSVQVILTKVINPLLPNISMHILHTVLYTFPKMLTRRICVTIKNLIYSW